MINNSSYKIQIVMVSGTWPSQKTGAGIAAQSALHIYAQRFSRVHFFGPMQEHLEDVDMWMGKKVSWVPLSLGQGPLWVRFLRSLVSIDPAITARFRVAADSFSNKLATIIDESRRRNHGVAIVYDDLPASCFLPIIRRRFPDIVQIARSHNIMVKGFSGLDKVGSIFSRAAWRVELAKIRLFEKRVCQISDAFWAISDADSKDYERYLGVKPDGVFGISMDPALYDQVETGDPYTVVHVGTADLRKGKGLRDFLTKAWPAIRLQEPRASLILGGRGTECFHNPAAGITGLGYVDDDRSVLGMGRIFINPQRIGAGIQLKSVVAMLAGKALVSTSMGTEGIEGIDRAHYLVSASFEDMAQHILDLMQSPEAAINIGRQARLMASVRFSFQQLEKSTDPLLDALVQKIIKRSEAYQDAV